MCTHLETYLYFTEYSGYWKKTSFYQEMNASTQEITFYDSVTGKPLFIAPRERTAQEFIKESEAHVRTHPPRPFPRGREADLHGSPWGRRAGHPSATPRWFGRTSAAFKTAKRCQTHTHAVTSTAPHPPPTPMSPQAPVRDGDRARGQLQLQGLARC